MIAIIADDITGAAEIAGIGLRFGLRVSMVTDLPEQIPATDLLVYATDTRSLPESDAVIETRRVISQLKKAGCTDFFKKTDSALRGHVLPELQAILQETGLPRVIYLPENPSKGRIIRNGIYYINDIPLDQTVFAQDPEFPAKTADVRKRLKGMTIINPEEEIQASGVFLANATNGAEIAQYIAEKNASTLLAGGADLFTAYLESKGYAEKKLPLFEGLGEWSAILVLGSTAGQSPAEFDYFKRRTVPFISMLEKVFEGKLRPESWFNRIVEVYELHHSIAIGVGYPSKGGAAFALRLRNTMADAVASLIDTRLPHELIIEGGATAFAILRRLGWHHFRITDEVAPGVVRMSLDDHPDVHLTLKPGSYEWGERLFQ